MSSLSLCFLGLLSTQCDRARGLSVDTVAVIYLLSYIYIHIYISGKPIDSFISFGNVQLNRKISTTLTLLKIKWSDGQWKYHSLKIQNDHRWCFCDCISVKKVNIFLKGYEKILTSHYEIALYPMKNSDKIN